uniref:Uncharacterized protein n=1 Tax=Stomoxys calcitrans TaxID=35570 RepID=A0A1I8NVC8_STOCA|nr:unnamed protein product [Stomoxys calcitrans]
MKMSWGNDKRRVILTSGLSTTFVTMLMVMLMEVSFFTLMTGQVTALKINKDSYTVFKSPVSSLSWQKSQAKHLKHRFRRETLAEDPYDYDENQDVIPEFNSQGPQTVGEHLSARAQKIAETFSNMWQSMVETIKHGVEAIRQLFDGDEHEYELTPEEQEQMHAAMEARAKAIEEQNEIWRNNNQL